MRETAVASVTTSGQFPGWSRLRNPTGECVGQPRGTVRERVSQQHELVERLGTLRLDGTSVWTDVVALLRSLLGLDFASVYQVRADASGRPVVNAMACDGGEPLTRGPTIRARYVQATQQMLDLGGVAYDPLNPERAQRNRTVDLGTLSKSGRLSEAGLERFQRWTHATLGLRAATQLRLLCCEGATCLAWVGGFREDRAFGVEDRRALQRLASPLQRRLALEERLHQHELVERTLEAALEGFGLPAVLVDGRARPVLANALTRAELKRCPSDLRAAFGAALHGDRSRFRRVPVTARGVGVHHLLVASPATTDGERRMVDCVSAWSLTPREADVLRLVVRGLTNDAIARERLCAPRTVELHVTHILTKAGHPNRASLVAAFWSGGARP